MKYIVLLIAVLTLASPVPAQPKPVDTMSRQAVKLGATKNITITYDQNSNSSKIMLVADNFGDHDVSRANIMAMNFASGFFFVGSQLVAAPEKMQFTFWVMSKKPRFAEGHNLEISAGSDTFVIGPARYAAKPSRNMEYLNYEISRKDLEKIAMQSKVIARIGKGEFQFTRQQLESLADLMLISDPYYLD